MGRFAVATLALLALATSANAREHVVAAIDAHETGGRREPAPEAAPPPFASEQILGGMADAGHHWRIDTANGPVHVWTPQNYDASTAAMVVFVHGYHTDVDAAWSDYRLEQQFALSGINAMFVAPVAPANKRMRIAWPSLDKLLAVVAANVDAQVPTRRLIAVGHSGAYRTLASWLSNQRLDTVVLLDALYAEYSFAPWVRASQSRRLLNIAYETDRYSDYMHRRLPETHRVIGLPKTGLPDARILYVKTFAGHYPLVNDGVALPLALRAVGASYVVNAPLDLPLGLSERCLLEP